jgi:hypothetical protein
MTLQVTLKDGLQLDVTGDLTFPVEGEEVSIVEVQGVALLGDIGLHVFDRFVGFVDDPEQSQEYRILEVLVPIDGMAAPLRVRAVLDKESAEELGRRLVQGGE